MVLVWCCATYCICALEISWFPAHTQQVCSAHRQMQLPAHHPPLPPTQMAWCGCRMCDLLHVCTAGDTATVCPECFNALKKENIPWCSLVCVDTGKVPCHLPKLSYTEAAILSPIRAVSQLVVMKPVKGTATHPRYSGHVLAFPNPQVAEKLVKTFPIHPDSLPEYINVVFCTPTNNSADLRAMCLRSPMLQVSCAALAHAHIT